MRCTSRTWKWLALITLRTWALLKNEWPPIFFIIAEATCQFKAPIQMDTPLVIQVRVSGLRNSSFGMDYQFVDQATGQILALGRTAQVMYDYTDGQVMYDYTRIAACRCPLSGVRLS